jgi:hypothetical protein
LFWASLKSHAVTLTRHGLLFRAVTLTRHSLTHRGVTVTRHHELSPNAEANRRI